MKQCTEGGGGGGGGNSLIQVGMDVQRVHACTKPRPGKISPKNLMPRQKGVQKPNDWASFHEL